MKKNAGKIVLAFLFTALTCSGTAFSLANATQTAYAQNSVAKSANVVENQAQTDLVSPTSYEQYLRLNKPSDIAFCADYIAIADENIIYLYDKKEGVYRKYEHTLRRLCAAARKDAPRPCRLSRPV